MCEFIKIISKFGVNLIKFDKYYSNFIFILDENFIIKYYIKLEGNRLWLKMKTRKIILM
jgi:hypothetical protein